MVLKTQHTGRAESEHRASRAEASEWLAGRRQELVRQLQQALEATAFSNRFLASPGYLPQAAQAEAAAFQSFCESGDIDTVRLQGEKWAQEGLGERAMLRLGTALRQFCRNHPGDQVLQAADVYTDALLEAFMQGRQAIIVREQEQLRKDLQQAMSHYALQLATASEVSRTVSSILNPAELLPEVVNLIRDRFNFYYVGFFLLDESGGYAILRAGTGEAGRQLLQMGHKLAVGGPSMIGWCTAHAKARIARDVDKDEARFDNPLLPETRSEIALPLIGRGRVIGAMTIQSDQSAAFSELDIGGLQTMADQVANAIETARLFQRTEESLEEISRLHQRYLRQEWQEYLADEEARARAGYLYAHGVVEPAGDVWMPEIAMAVQRGETVVLPPVGAEPPAVTALDAPPQPSPARAALAVPLALRGQVIGALDFYEADQSRHWSRDDIALVESVADQVALAIENARAYAELQKTTEQLKEVDRLKSQFLANMSHELRTPLNSIIGFSRVILKGIDGPLTDMQRTDLQAVYDGGQHLLGLINDILDISKIEAGRMELTLEDVDLQGIIKGVMSTAIALVKGKPIELQQSIPPDLPTIHGDARRIRQVLLNLVSNASKFTDEGFIRVEAELHPTEIVVSVADSGIGIPPDKIDVIFEPFTQADASTTRRVGGTGLGLSISKRLAEIHGGRIWVESTLDVGSTFYVAFPLEPPPEPALSAVEGTEQAGAEDETGLVVLCVDDDEGVITLFRRYLSKKGYRVFGLTDSTSTVERAAQLNPFAITLDVMMPDKDGWQVMQELKADPNTHHIPVIICTIVGEKEYGISLGATDYLIKPILEEELIAALERLDRKAGRHLVLVVDDQQENRDLLRRMIESQEGYEVVEAIGGLEAIEMVRQIQPHVIILDLMMPDVDGFAVLEAVKSDKATRSIPIIVVTAKDLTQEERDTLNKGVEALLQKGLFEQQELLADVAAALERISAGADEVAFMGGDRF